MAKHVVDGNDSTTSSSKEIPASVRLSWIVLGGWTFGIGSLIALVIFVLHVGDAELFLAAIQRADPIWILLAVCVQCATYACASAVWFVLLHKAGLRLPVRSLLRLAVVELFVNQALPSGGISGAFIVAKAMVKRGVPAPAATSALIGAALSYYAAYIAVATTAAVVLWESGSFDRHWMMIAASFLLLIAILTALLITLLYVQPNVVPQRLRSMTQVAHALEYVRGIDASFFCDPGIFLRSMILQSSIFLMDALTLWLVLRSFGVAASPTHVFSAFVLASVAGTLSPIPLGLGTFDGTCVALLHSVGVGLEEALAATLILRALTFWLPMLPGVLLLRGEMRLLGQSSDAARSK